MELQKNAYVVLKVKSPERTSACLEPIEMPAPARGFLSFQSLALKSVEKDRFRLVP